MLFGLPALAALGCVVAGTVLKSPVQQRCEATGLKGCPDVVDGVLLYVQGDQAAATEKLRVGAAQNSPEDVRKFAQTLLEVSSVPGASQFAGPVTQCDRTAKARCIGLEIVPRPAERFLEGGGGQLCERAVISFAVSAEALEGQGEIGLRRDAQRATGSDDANTQVANLVVTETGTGPAKARPIQSEVARPSRVSDPNAPVIARSPTLPRGAPSNEVHEVRVQASDCDPGALKQPCLLR